MMRQFIINIFKNCSVSCFKYKKDANMCGYIYPRFNFNILTYRLSSFNIGLTKSNFRMALWHKLAEVGSLYADVNDEVVEPVTKTRGARAAKLTKITKTPIDNEEEEEQPKKSTRAVRNKADPPIKTESKSKKKNSKENGAIQPDENGVDENKGKETKRNTKRKVVEKAENVENSSVTPKKKKIVKEDGKKDTKKAKDTAATNKKATAGTKEAKPAQNQTSTKWNTIDFGNSKKSANGETNNFKITSWNVDGIRAWLKKGGLNIIEHDNPDILCLQETKCSEEKLPEEVTDLEGYHQYWCSSDKEGYAGVGVYTKEEPISVVKGIGDKEQDNEGRCLTLEYDKFYLVNVYVPNAGRGLVTLPKRLNFNESFKAYIKKLDKKKPVIVCGDMNVAHNEIDLKNPKTNKKNAGFTQEERDGMTDFLSDGYIDSLRELYPDQEEIYTFWSYMSNARAKNIGWRLDYFIYSERIKDLICDSVVRSEVYGSDHCPISLFIHF
ncbi:recombination repair protein 1 isoform X2 [Rhynchophorus ferrugineus]|uniref:recombination repair protein 1 isoform X2 n=1 Tax=Rhynchophorus ferrugineus TaxID=354439 RepID=UPI003FCE0D13